jgi:hypothetical protein
MFVLKAILIYDFLIFTFNSIGIVYELLLYFYVGQCTFCPTQIAHARENTTSGQFVIATDRVVKRSIARKDAASWCKNSNDARESYVFFLTLSLNVASRTIMPMTYVYVSMRSLYFRQ